MSDYDRIARAIAFLISQAGDQPALEAIASHVHLSPFHFQRLFSRWVGVSPKRFLQILTLQRAKALLNNPVPLLEVSESVGLSSASRLYDSFINIEAITPGEFKRHGAGLEIEYGVHETPFGLAFIANTARGICKFSFMEGLESISEQLQELEESWPRANLIEFPDRALELIESIFGIGKPPDRPLSLLVSGTNFQVNVWKALLRIPPARVASYTQIATALGRADCARAVGNAVAKNPVGFLIPCHRAIQQSGCIGGYHWGEVRIHALHAWESARN